MSLRLVRRPPLLQLQPAARRGTWGERVVLGPLGLLGPAGLLLATPLLAALLLLLVASAPVLCLALPVVAWRQARAAPPLARRPRVALRLVPAPRS